MRELFMCLWCFFSPPRPPHPAECFTPTGLSGILVKLSILCMYRGDQYSPRQQANRVEKLLKPTRRWSRKAKPRWGQKTNPDACPWAAPFHLSSSHQSNPNKNKCNFYLDLLLSGCNIFFFQKRTKTKQGSISVCRMISVPSDYTSASVSGSHPIIKG